MTWVNGNTKTKQSMGMNIIQTIRIHSVLSWKKNAPTKYTNAISHTDSRTFSNVICLKWMYVKEKPQRFVHLPQFFFSELPRQIIMSLFLPASECVQDASININVTGDLCISLLLNSFRLLFRSSFFPFFCAPHISVSVCGTRIISSRRDTNKSENDSCSNA